MREVTVGGVMVLAAATGFGTLAIFGKFAEAAGLGRPTLLFFRFLLGSAIVWTVLAVTRDARLLHGRPLRATLVLGVIYAALTMAYFWGLSFMTASLTAIVFYTYPIWVFTLSVAFLDERVTRPVVGALGLALAGVVLVIGFDASQVSIFGIMLVTAGAVGYAVYNVSGRALTAQTNPTVLTAHVLLVTTATIGLRWLQAGAVVPETGTQWWIIVGIGIIGTGIPLILLYEGLQRVEATHASILGTAEPISTVIFGVVILGEALGPRTIAGGVLIIAGVTMVQSSRRQRRWLLSKVGLH